jgi:hypothetical protein
MRFAIRDLPLLGLFAMPLCGPAQATDYEVGTNLVCDTQTRDRPDQRKTSSRADRDHAGRARHRRHCAVSAGI